MKEGKGATDITATAPEKGLKYMSAERNNGPMEVQYQILKQTSSLLPVLMRSQDNFDPLTDRNLEWGRI